MTRLLMSSLLLLASGESKDLTEARLAAAAGRFDGEGGALTLIEEALTAPEAPSDIAAYEQEVRQALTLRDALQVSSSTLAKGEREALQHYQDALEEVLKHDRLARKVYASAGKDAAAEVIKALKGLEKVKANPDLLAHAFRLERWVSQFEELRSDAVTLRKSKNFDAALQRYEEMADHELATLPEIRQELEDAKATLSQERSNARSEFVRQVIWRPLSVAFGIIALGWVYRRLQKVLARWSKRTRLKVYDLSGESAPTGESDSQALRLKLVFQEVALHRPPPRFRQESSFGEALPRWGRLVKRDLQAIHQYMSGTEKVTLGPVSIPAKAFWQFFSQFFTLTRYTWLVIVRREPNLLQVTAAVTDVVTGEQRTWVAAVPGGDKASDVNEAFRRLVLMYAYDSLTEKPVTNAEAFVFYYDGLRALGDRKLLAAKESFQRARALDPYSADVKLMLAIVLCMLGEPESSRALLGELQTENALTNEVMYHEALLDAQSHRFDSLKQARNKLEPLSKGEGSLAVEAKALLLNVCVTLLSDKDFKGQLDTHSEQEMRKLVQTLEDFFSRDSSANQPQIDPHTYAQARGYALYAQGQLKVREGAVREGLGLMQRALTYVPDLLVAHVAIARAYRKGKVEFNRAWEQLAESALKRAIELNPDDPAANYQYGQFQLARAVKNPDEAARYFEAASHRWAAARYQLGVLKGKKNASEGLRLILEAIHMSGEMHPYYVRGIVECLAVGLKAAAVMPPASGSLSTAHALADMLRGDDPEHARTWIEATREELTAYVKQRPDSDPIKQALMEFQERLGLERHPASAAQ